MRPLCVLLRQARQRRSSSSKLSRRVLLHALSAKDGGLMPQHQRPTRPPRLHRLCARLTRRAGAAQGRRVSYTKAMPISALTLPLPGAINPAQRPREQPRQRSSCCAPTLPLRLTMHSAAPRGPARRRLQLLPDNSKHAPIPRRPAPPVLPQPLPVPGPSLALVLTLLRVLHACAAPLSVTVRVQR